MIGSVEINCEDVNDEVAINKEIAQLVMDKPVIIVDVVDSTVTEGDQVKFVVEATGMDLSYQWQVSVDGGVNFTTIDGAVSATYTTTAEISKIIIITFLNCNKNFLKKLSRFCFSGSFANLSG